MQSTSDRVRGRGDRPATHWSIVQPLLELKTCIHLTTLWDDAVVTWWITKNVLVTNSDPFLMQERWGPDDVPGDQYSEESEDCGHWAQCGSHGQEGRLCIFEYPQVTSIQKNLKTAVTGHNVAVMVRKVVFAYLNGPRWPQYSEESENCGNWAQCGSHGQESRLCVKY